MQVIVHATLRSETRGGVLRAAGGWCPGPAVVSEHLEHLGKVIKVIKNAKVINMITYLPQRP